MPPDATAPLIVTAMLGAGDHAWFDSLRRAHFPPERNHLSAHLTVFHHLPPSVADEVRHRLRALTHGQPAPTASIGGVLSLGRGVAYRIVSPDLESIRAELADAFDTVLVPQDRARWRPHVTIQNKVEPGVARALHADLSRDFRPRPVAIAGLASWWYRGGPWEAHAAYKFA